MESGVRQRLDVAITKRKLVATRSQAEQEIAFGHVSVNGRIITKSSFMVGPEAKIRLINKNPYVSRAGLKLASVAKVFNLDFKNKLVLDVGSSTGGFTDYALANGANKVLAVDVGTNQLHPKLRADGRVEVYEQTDIRQFKTNQLADIALIDVSFISIKEILFYVKKLIKKDGTIVAMFKPQFEAGSNQVNKGVIKNNTIRRSILKDFEAWLEENNFVATNKLDSAVKGEKGNQERFYLLK